MTPPPEQLRPDAAAIWSLPASGSPATAGPDDWHAGPAAWGARPLDETVDGLAFLALAALVALAAGVVVLVAGGEAWPAVVVLLAILVAGGGTACWLDLRAHGLRARDLERGALARPLWGLKGRFAGGSCVDALPASTRVAIGQNPSGEVCLYANGREYPLTRGELERLRATLIVSAEAGAPGRRAGAGAGGGA